MKIAIKAGESMGDHGTAYTYITKKQAIILTKRYKELGIEDMEEYLKTFNVLIEVTQRAIKTELELGE